MRPRLSKIFCRLASSKRMVIGTGLRGESTATGTRSAACARAFIWSNSARSRCSSSCLRMRSRTIARSSAIERLAGS